MEVGFNGLFKGNCQVISPVRDVSRNGGIGDEHVLPRGVLVDAGEPALGNGGRVHRRRAQRLGQVEAGDEAEVGLIAPERNKN